MGSLVMHLCVAKRLKEKYNFSDRFIIGNLMPDLLKIAAKSREETHYIESIIENSGVKFLPNISKYERENKEELKDEIKIGYLSHLIQDKIWFDKYIGKYAKKDANNINLVKYLEYNITKTDKEFSEDIYNDYYNINKYLSEKYKLNIDNIKNKLYEVSPNNIRNKVSEMFLLNDCDFTKENTFITKSDLDGYINDCVKKTSVEIDRVLKF